MLGTYWKNVLKTYSNLRMFCYLKYACSMVPSLKLYVRGISEQIQHGMHVVFICTFIIIFSTETTFIYYKLLYLQASRANPKLACGLTLPPSFNTTADRLFRYKHHQKYQYVNLNMVVNKTYQYICSILPKKHLTRANPLTVFSETI